MEGELRANRARQVAMEGFYMASQKLKITAISLAFCCVFYIVIGGSIIFLVDRSIFLRGTAF